MTLQEILTYVEEIEFKNSMFGYDKDEVDIQLDKICDEVEILVTQKDKEIEELKKALTIVNTTADAQPEDMAEAFAETETAPVEVEEVAEDMVTRAQYDAVVAECTQLKVALEQAQADIAAAKEEAAQSDEAAQLVVAQIDSAQAMVNEAQAEAKAAQAEIEELKAELAKMQATGVAEAVEEVEEAVEEVEEAAAEEATETVEEIVPVVEEAVEEVEEKAVVEETPAAPTTPQTTDQAYTQYMMYADLLCKQLAEVETKHETIVKEATAEADQIRANAQSEADQIITDAQNMMDAKAAEAAETVQNMIEEAKAEADKTVADAKAEAETIVNNAKEEAEAVGQEYMESAAAAEEQCKQLQEKKDTLVASLAGFGEEISALLAKVQGAVEE